MKHHEEKGGASRRGYEHINGLARILLESREGQQRYHRLRKYERFRDHSQGVCAKALVKIPYHYWQKYQTRTEMLDPL